MILKKTTIFLCFGLSVSASWLNAQETTLIPSPTVQVAEADLEQLLASADANPSDLKAQLSYAQKLFEHKKLREAWQRLRATYERAPDNQGVLTGLQAVIEAYKWSGLLSVGTAENEVLNLLGQPHHTLKMPWGVRHVFGLIAVDFRDGRVYELINLAGATEELFDASHVINVSLGSPTWHVGIRQKGDGLTTAILFPPGESVATWEEMVTIERFVGQAQDRSMDEIVAMVQEQLKAKQLNAEVTVIEKNESSAILAAVFPAIETQPGRQQIVRLWKAPRDLHRMAYTHQGDFPPVEKANQWLTIFKNAKLEQYDPSVSATSLENSPRNQVKKLAERLQANVRNATQFKPTESALNEIAANAEALEKLQAYAESVYKDLDGAPALARPDQTEIIVFGPALEDLPGGYSSVREHFKSEAKFYGFKYVVPGETSGMSFDGVFEVEGKWYFLPKAHRAFR